MYHKKQSVSGRRGGGFLMLLWSKTAAPGQCHALPGCAQHEEAPGCLQQLSARPFWLGALYFVCVALLLLSLSFHHFHRPLILPLYLFVSTFFFLGFSISLTFFSLPLFSLSAVSSLFFSSTLSVFLTSSFLPSLFLPVVFSLFHSLLYVCFSPFALEVIMTSVRRNLELHSRYFCSTTLHKLLSLTRETRDVLRL